MLDAARQAVADLVGADPQGVVLGADRAVLLTSLADASSSRVGLGYEVVVTRLDDEANIAPWLRAANRYGAKVKWAEVDIETGELPDLAVGEPDHAARPVWSQSRSASSTLGTVTDLRAVTKLVHEVGGLVVVDHSAAAPYRLIDIDEIDADVVAVNAMAWGGPPIGALVFRDPSIIDSFGSVSLNPYATGPARLEVGAHQFGMLAGVVASIEYLAGLDESAQGSRRERLSVSMQSASTYMSRVFDYLLIVAALAVRGDGDRPARGAHSGAELRGQRRARRDGWCSGWPTTASWRSPTPARACSTSSASTTSAAR